MTNVDSGEKMSVRMYVNSLTHTHTQKTIYTQSQWLYQSAVRVNAVKTLGLCNHRLTNTNESLCTMCVCLFTCLYACVRVSVQSENDIAQLRQYLLTF